LLQALLSSTSGKLSNGKPARKPRQKTAGSSRSAANSHPAPAHKLTRFGGFFVAWGQEKPCNAKYLLSIACIVG
jgi:hypothetical protein